MSLEEILKLETAPYESFIIERIKKCVGCKELGIIGYDENYCKACGCPLPSRAKKEENKCPLNKW